MEHVESTKGAFFNFLFGNCKMCSKNNRLDAIQFILSNYHCFFIIINLECGVPNRNARLIGGEYLRSYEFPWLTLIYAKNETIVGSLISDRYILTAATPLIGSV